MKVLAFGDSFVKMFLHCEPEVKHWKFKGKSVKGLAKQQDSQRRKIEREIRKAPNGTKILLFFGQVDFNYVRYYKVIKGEPPIVEQTFKKYVEWVASMNYRKNISIVSIFPSPIKRQYVVPSLISKGSYSEQQQNAEIDQKILNQFDKSPQIWQLWNSWISQHCKKNKVENLKLFDKNQLQPQFYDISNLTIHLRYVPVLKLVQKFISISFDITKAQQIQKEYEKQKTNRISNSAFKLSSEKDQQNVKEELSTIIETAQQNTQKQQEKQLDNQEREERKGLIQKQKTEDTTDPEINSFGSSPLAENNDTSPVQQVQEEKAHTKQIHQELTVKNERKTTIDLDDGAVIDRDRSKSKQASNNIRSSSNEPVQQSKKPRKKKNGKKKSKAAKQKKQYEQKEENQSDDEGEMFLQLSNLSNKVKKRSS